PATFVCERSTITNISDHLRERGSFRSGFIHFNLQRRRTHRVCAAGKLSCSDKPGLFELRNCFPAITPESQLIWCARSKSCARREICRDLFTFAQPSRPCAAAVRKAAIKIPNQCLSISKAICSWKFFIAG